MGQMPYLRRPHGLSQRLRHPVPGREARQRAIARARGGGQGEVGSGDCVAEEKSRRLPRPYLIGAPGSPDLITAMKKTVSRDNACPPVRAGAGNSPRHRGGVLRGRADYGSRGGIRSMRSLLRSRSPRRAPAPRPARRRTNGRCGWRCRRPPLVFGREGRGEGVEGDLEDVRLIVMGQGPGLKGAGAILVT